MANLIGSGFGVSAITGLTSATIAASGLTSSNGLATSSTTTGASNFLSVISTVSKGLNPCTAGGVSNTKSGINNFSTSNIDLLIYYLYLSSHNGDLLNIYIIYE